MRRRYEFALHRLDDAQSVDPTLALMGAQGWELRGLAAAAGAVIVALQRPLDEDVPLPDAPTLAATLEEPLAAPTASELEEAVRGAEPDPA
jgi:hypothetical protein